MNLADAVEIVRERRQRGAHEEAARLLREYIIQWPESLELQIEDASLAHDKGDVDLEIQKWRMITEGDTKDIPTGVFLRMSAALRRNGSWEEALQALDSPLNLRKDGFETLFQKGLIREQQSDLNEAKRCFERSLEVASTEAQAFQANMRLSLILAKQNKFRKARKLLASTVEIAKATDGNIRTFKRFTAIIDYKEAAAKAPDAWAAYWNERKEYVYLHVCKQILGIVGASARSAADIGSNFFPTFPTVSRSTRRILTWLTVSSRFVNHFSTGNRHARSMWEAASRSWNTSQIRRILHNACSNYARCPSFLCHIESRREQIRDTFSQILS
jgi:tetratricopeptide (TPR) repeat protein